MNALFIELYLDEDVDVLVAELVRAYGFDVLTARDAGQLGQEDEDQLAYAVSVGRAVLTHKPILQSWPRRILRRVGSITAWCWRFVAPLTKSRIGCC